MPAESLGLVWQPRFSYGSGPTTLDLKIPARAWRFVRSNVGGSRTAAAGVPAAYLVRQDRLLELVLRFYESEWASIEALIEHGQKHPNTVTVYPDQTVLGTSYSCYLMRPLAGEEWAPERDAEAPFVLELPTVWRKVSLAAWTDNYFGI